MWCDGVRTRERDVRPSRMRHCGVKSGSLPDSNHDMTLIISEIGPKVVLSSL